MVGDGRLEVGGFGGKKLEVACDPSWLALLLFRETNPHFLLFSQRKHKEEKAKMVVVQRQSNCRARTLSTQAGCNHGEMLKSLLFMYTKANDARVASVIFKRSHV